MSTKLNSNALFITIVIALVIGIFCTLLLLSVYNNLSFDREVIKDNRLHRDLQSAVDLVLADTSLILTEQQLTFDLFDQGKDSITISKEAWGLFGVANVKAFSDGKSINRCFFLGRAAGPALNECLYLADHHAPLSVVGFTKLKGNAYLPQGSLRSAMIDGRGFAFPELIVGAVERSKASLPSLDLRLINRLLLQAPQNGRNKVDQMDLELVPRNMERFFSDTPATIYCHGWVDLAARNFKGHIRIVSDTGIVVRRSTRLVNVLLIAPVIEFEDGFSGTVQAIASDSIVVRSDCHFMYPSCLVVLSTGRGVAQPKIIMGSNCAVEGMIMAYIYGLHDDDLVRTYVELGLNTKVTGCVYVSGYLFLAGSVHGTVLTDYLIYKSPSTVYGDYLVDAEIDRTALPYSFGMPNIFFDDRNENKIVQWVN